MNCSQCARHTFTIAGYRSCQFPAKTSSAGSKLPFRSRGTARSTAPTSVSTVLGVVPLRPSPAWRLRLGLLYGRDLLTARERVSSEFVL